MLRYQRLIEQQAEDLPLHAWLQCLLFAAATMVAKWIAVGIAHHGEPIDDRLRAWARGASWDGALIAALFLAALASRRLPAVSRRWRRLCWFLLTVVCAALVVVTFLNVEFFAAWAAPLSRELLHLAPALYRYIFMVGFSDKAGTLTAAMAAVAVAPLLTPFLVSGLRRAVLSGRRWSWRAYVPLAMGALAFVPALHSSSDFRELLLRRLSLVGLLSTVRTDAADAPAPTAGDRSVIAGLLGPAPDDAARALARLPRRRLNVVLWVWESVGARFLRSFHPDGVAATPNLDRALARGSVDFVNAYAECPLTVQSTWALVTGLSPPAKPFVFAFFGYDPRVPFPRHGPVLHGELARAGYQSSLFYSSYSRMWGTFRIFELAPLDTFEDADSLRARARELPTSPEVEGVVGVEDDIIYARALEWIDSRRADRPWMTILWNIETHLPFMWVGMPASLRTSSRLDRYHQAIERADEKFGRFYDALESRGLLEDTLIVVVGDHGQGVGRPPRTWDVGHSTQVWEDDIHVPLAFLHPDLAAAPGAGRTRVEPLATHADIFPTLLDLLGLPPVGGLDGRSLARPQPPRPFFAHSFVWWPVAAHVGPYKLVVGGPMGARALYRLSTDRGEEVDLFDREPDVARALTAELFRWHNERFANDPTFGYRYDGWLPVLLRR